LLARVHVTVAETSLACRTWKRDLDGVDDGNVEDANRGGVDVVQLTDGLGGKGEGECRVVLGVEKDVGIERAPASAPSTAE
jgi:hypothetical protein